MPSLAITRRHSPLLAITRNQLPVPKYMMPMAQRQGRECADCLGNRRLERRLSLRRAKKHAFHGRGKLLLVGVMRQQKLQLCPLCPRQHCPTAWKNVSHYAKRALHRGLLKGTKLSPIFYLRDRAASSFDCNPPPRIYQLCYAANHAGTDGWSMIWRRDSLLRGETPSHMADHAKQDSRLKTQDLRGVS